jgi:hypothetical protein
MSEWGTCGVWDLAARWRCGFVERAWLVMMMMIGGDEVRNLCNGGFEFEDVLKADASNLYYDSRAELKDWS